MATGNWQLWFDLAAIEPKKKLSRMRGNIGGREELQLSLAEPVQTLAQTFGHIWISFAKLTHGCINIYDY